MRTPIQIGSVAQQVESTGFTGNQYTSFAKNHLRPVLLERRFTDKNQSEELSPSFSSGAIETIGDQPLAARFSRNFGQIPIFSKTQTTIQAKLGIGAPKDVFEQEADRIAERVMRMPQTQFQRDDTPGGLTSNSQGSQQRFELDRIQTKPDGVSSASPFSAPPIVNEILNSPGQPLDAQTRAYFEPRFGQDFGRVRIHSDARAAESARAVSALAYTVGNDIVFRGQWDAEGSTRGMRLLAHELAHVVQQNTLRTALPHLQRAPEDQAQPRRDVAIVGEDWEGAEELAIVLAGGGRVHNVTSLAEAAAVLEAIDYPVRTLYIITHSTVNGDLQFGIGEKMVDPDRIGQKLKGLISNENAPQRVDFRGCSVGTDPKAMEKIRNALGAQSVIGGTCYAVIQRSTPIEIPVGKPVTRASDVTAENRKVFEELFASTAKKLGSETCIVNRAEDDYFAVGGGFVALWFNPSFTPDWVPGESVCYNALHPQVVDPKKAVTSLGTCELIQVDAKSASKTDEEIPSNSESEQTPVTDE